MDVLASIVASADADEAGAKFGFRSLRLRVELSRPGLSTSTWLGRPEATIGDARIVMMGAERTPTWTIEASPGILNGDYTTQDRVLCLLHGAGAGDALEGEVAVRLTDPDSIGTITGSPIAPETEAVLRLIFERELPGSTDSFGWKTLGRQQVKVGRA